MKRFRLILKATGVFIIAMIMDKTTEANILSLNRSLLLAFSISDLLRQSQWKTISIIFFGLWIFLEKVLAVFALKWPSRK